MAASPTVARKLGVVRLVWHRQDLRLSDNPLYSGLDYDDSASEEHGEGGEKPTSISLYVFDPADFISRPSTCAPGAWDAVNVGPHAARLLREAVAELRGSVRSRGGELLIRHGDPAEVIPAVAREVGAEEVRWSEEPGVYEAQMSTRVRWRLMEEGIKVKTEVGCTLFHPDDLPKEGEEWARLAHPRQKTGKKKKKKAGPGNRGKSGDQPAPGGDEAGVIATLVQHEIANVFEERWKGAPRIMGDFRRAARTAAPVRSMLPPPKRLSKPPQFDGGTAIEVGDIPTLKELLDPLLVPSDRPLLGLNRDTVRSVVRRALDRDEHDFDSRSGDDVTCGGESCAMERLRHFIGGGHAASADRSLADVSGDGSSKLSAHLALGTVSPRAIHEAAARGGDGCSWLCSHLEMRDFFLYLAFASGSRLFGRGGMPVRKKTEPIAWRNPADDGDAEALEWWRRWAGGDTGLPIIDAAMTELLSTGYCSNRVRQNMASVLTKDLGIDWRAGAELFQFLLEDHCVGSNWGNWLYFSGVGPDPKQRHFRTVSQALRYDPDGDYVRKWIPELAGESNRALFHPWDFVRGWRKPIIDTRTHLTWQDWETFEEERKLLADT